MSPTLPIEDIAATAFLTAFYRAVESDRPDAHFQDPYARMLAGVRGEQIFQAIPNTEGTALGTAVRTCVIDEMLLQTIEQEKVDTVLNLGAGLDTRPYRLSLPPTLNWIECDLPALVAYKADKLAEAKPTCILESVALDLTDIQARQTLFAKIGRTAKRAIALTEGVLIYLHPTQVASLAQHLYNHSQFSLWLLELASPSALKHIEASQQGLKTGKTKLQFAPQEGTAFFQQYGWQTVEFRSFFEEAQRLQRGELPPEVLAQLSPEQGKLLRKLSGFVLLKRKD